MLLLRSLDLWFRYILVAVAAVVLKNFNIIYFIRMRNWLSLRRLVSPWAAEKCLQIAFMIGDLISLGLKCSSNLLLINTGCSVVPILWLRSRICFFTALADVWSWKGKLSCTTLLSSLFFSRANLRCCLNYSSLARIIWKTMGPILSPSPTA